jgi:hypothetical protein
VKFETSTALEAHLVSVHRKTYQCIKCQVKKYTLLKIVNTVLLNTSISSQLFTASVSSLLQNDMF